MEETSTNDVPSAEADKGGVEYSDAEVAREGFSALGGGEVSEPAYDWLTPEQLEDPRWKVYESDTFAQVYEFDHERRLQLWTEGDELAGTSEGWSWQEQVWTGQDWADIEDITATRDARALVQQMEWFRKDAEATSLLHASPTELHAHKMATGALLSMTRMQEQLQKLQSTLTETESRLHASETKSAKIESALITMGQRLVTPSTTPRTAAENTGPTTAPAEATTSGPAL